MNDPPKSETKLNVETIINIDIDRILRTRNTYEVFRINATFLSNPEWKKNLKKIYSNLCLKVHPDKNKDPRATEAFQKLSTAYNYILSHPRTDPTKPTREDPTVIPPFNYKTAYKTAFGREFRKGTKDEFFRDFFREATNNNGKTTKNSQTKKTPAPHRPAMPPAFDICQAKTKRGVQCKRQAVNLMYCHAHMNYDPAKEPVKTDINQCSEMTKKGTRCTKKTSDTSGKCHLHK